jgi:hypothetical protein
MVRPVKESHGQVCLYLSNRPVWSISCPVQLNTSPEVLPYMPTHAQLYFPRSGTYTEPTDETLEAKTELADGLSADWATGQGLVNDGTPLKDAANTVPWIARGRTTLKPADDFSWAMVGPLEAPFDRPTLQPAPIYGFLEAGKGVS